MIVCGIDEAGRGSFVGPMVIAGVAVEYSSVSYLHEEGVRDSKILSPKFREKLYHTILDVATDNIVQKICPQTIDNSVLFHGLADLELKKMAHIISDMHADEYYVDSCYANASLFEGKLYEHTVDRTIHSHTKADSKFTVVAAASIVAKVVRDRAVANIRRVHPVGSGYPSDSRAAECVSRIYHSTGMFPSFARRSWYTACRIAGDQRILLHDNVLKQDTTMAGL